MLPNCAMHLCEVVTVLLLLLQFSESKRCLKREVIGNRENNDYECNHPVYSECCEHGNRFTCCEPLLPKNIREQLQLWGMVAMMVVVGVVVYACLAKDDMIKADTLKQALGNVGRKIGIGKNNKENEGTLDEDGNSTTSDQIGLTSATGRVTGDTRTATTRFYNV